MRGEGVTLRDIVLGEVECEPPQAIRLECDEQIEDSDQEAELVPELAAYKVLVPCGFCKKALRLWCRANSETIRQLENLLLHNLDFVCKCCGRSRSYDG